MEALKLWRQEQARAATEIAWKAKFFSEMRAFAGSASEASMSSHAHGADTRRGVPPALRECAIEEVLWHDFPDVPPETVAGAWAAFKDKSSVLARSSARSVERARVHAVLTSIVECAMGGECHLKYWYEKKPLDAFPTHNIIPDFSFTATNDASLATIALQVLLEAKLEHDYDSSMISAGNYARRTEAARVEEADARGEGNLEGVCTFSFGSDARTIGIVRVSSGAPVDGASYEGAPAQCMVACRCSETRTS